MKRSAAARAALAVAVLIPAVAISAIVGLSTGAGALSLRDALAGREPDATVLFRLRVPRVILAAEVGAALSVAGVALQALLRNPLADPFVFGLSGGAAIGTALVTVASGTALGVAASSAASFVGVLPAQLAAVAGAMAAALLVFTLGRARGQLEPARALLVGVVFNSFASALVLSVEAVLRPDQMQAVSLWLAGALGYEPMPLLTGAALALVVPALVLVALAGRLNLLALGDEGAAALGVDVGRTRILAFFAASAAVGIAVACSTYLSGIISWLCTMFLFGAGMFTDYLQQLAENRVAGEVLGIDRSEVAVIEAQQRAKTAGLKNVRFLTADLDNFISQEKFDAVVGRLVLMYPPDPSAKLQGLAGRSTEPNGVDGDFVPTREVGEYWPLVRP